MLGNEKLLFDELYEKTKDCGRVQFVKLLMAKEKENKELKKQLENYKKLGFRCEKALEYLDKIETLAMSDGKIIFSINTFRNILQNEKK